MIGKFYKEAFIHEQYCFKKTQTTNKKICFTYSAMAQFQMYQGSLCFTTYLERSIDTIRNVSVVLIHPVFTQLVQAGTLSHSSLLATGCLNSVQKKSMTSSASEETQFLVQHLCWGYIILLYILLGSLKNLSAFLKYNIETFPYYVLLPLSLSPSCFAVSTEQGIGDVASLL